LVEGLRREKLGRLQVSIQVRASALFAVVDWVVLVNDRVY
jgi:hypothetical protein